jgi:uncharacterized protein (DUF1778 family)
MRDSVIRLRATPEQRDLINRAACLSGKNRSDFILEPACEKAQSAVLEQVLLEFDEERFRQFTALLDVPSAPNLGLERLLAVRAPWDR